MKYRSRILSVILAVSLVIGTVIPINLIVRANNRYIDEDCRTKNTYDEEDITYTFEEIDADGKTSYVTVRDTLGVGEYKLSRHGKFTEDVGIDGSNAIRFYQVRGSSETDKDVSYIRIFSSEASKYNWFLPVANTKYTVKISYKSDKNYKFILREVGDFGEISYNDTKLSDFANESVYDEWNIASAEFTASKNPTSIYIAIATENGESNLDAEVYIDNVAVMLSEVEEEYKTGSKYESTLTDLSAMATDGWVASYSSDPQRGVAFTDTA